MVVTVPEALAWPLKVPASLDPGPRHFSQRPVQPECPEPAHSSWCLLFPPGGVKAIPCAEPGQGHFAFPASAQLVVSSQSRVSLGPLSSSWPHILGPLLALPCGGHPLELLRSALLSVDSQRPCGQTVAPGGLWRSCGPHLGRPAWQRLLPLSFWHILLPCLAWPQLL